MCLELQTAFSLLDNDADGVLTSRDLQSAARMLGHSLQEDSVMKIMKRLGKDGRDGEYMVYHHGVVLSLIIHANPIDIVPKFY